MRIDDDGAVWPETEQGLIDYLRSLTADSAAWEGGDGYNKSADALWRGTVAAFNYMAHLVGASGFQAGWAGMHVLRHTHGLQGAFAIVDGDNLLYPQYDLRAKLEEWIAEWMPGIARKAQKLLAEYEAEPEESRLASPVVVAHWRKLAAMAPAENGKES